MPETENNTFRPSATLIRCRRRCWSNYQLYRKLLRLSGNLAPPCLSQNSTPWRYATAHVCNIVTVCIHVWSGFPHSVTHRHTHTHTHTRAWSHNKQHFLFPATFRRQYIHSLLHYNITCTCTESSYTFTHSTFPRNSIHLCPCLAELHHSSTHAACCFVVAINMAKHHSLAPSVYVTGECIVCIPMTHRC